MRIIKEFLLKHNLLLNAIHVCILCDCGNVIKGYYIRNSRRCNNIMVALIKCKKCGKYYKIRNQNGLTLRKKSEAVIEKQVCIENLKEIEDYLKNKK